MEEKVGSASSFGGRCLVYRTKKTTTPTAASTPTTTPTMMPAGLEPSTSWAAESPSDWAGGDGDADGGGGGGGGGGGESSRGASTMETTLAVYEDVVRKVLAADGVARTVAREFVALVAAAVDGRLIVKVRRTLAETTSKVTAAGGTPASVATACVSSVRTVAVKSETDPATTTVVETVATVGGSGGGDGEGDAGGAQER